MATSPTFFRVPVRSARVYEYGPKELGAGAVLAIVATCRLVYARLTNRTAGAITVSITDGQGSAIDVFPPVVLTPGGFITFKSDDGGDLCPGGVIINASAPGIHAYVKAEEP